MFGSFTEGTVTRHCNKEGTVTSVVLLLLKAPCRGSFAIEKKILAEIVGKQELAASPGASKMAGLRPYAFFGAPGRASFSLEFSITMEK